MPDARPTEIVRDTFSYGYWLKNGRTNQATDDSLEVFDRWYESEKRKWQAEAFQRVIDFMQKNYDVNERNEPKGNPVHIAMHTHTQSELAAVQNVVAGWLAE